MNKNIFNLKDKNGKIIRIITVGILALGMIVFFALSSNLAEKDDIAAIGSTVEDSDKEYVEKEDDTEVVPSTEDESIESSSNEPNVNEKDKLNVDNKKPIDVATSEVNNNSNSTNTSDSETSNTTKPEPPHSHTWVTTTNEETYNLTPTNVLGACNSCGVIVQDGRTGVDIVKDHMLSTMHGSWHGDYYEVGICYECGGSFSFRQCAFGSSTREQCKSSESFVYINELSENAFMYYKVCNCGKNLKLVNQDGKGLIAKKVTTCSGCGISK